MDYRAFLLSPQGRVNRQPFWMFLIVSTVLSMVVAGVGQAINEPLANVFSLLLFWPALMVEIKRCHDRGRSGWFLLLFCVPVLNVWPLVELFFLRGTVGPNRFGPDPLGVTSIAYAT